ncbi:hydrogenase expression/formation protein HypE [Lysinibacillus sp. BW-2-10]|uniref:hydrogenase expression/formation protein HypE n=1 Tax=Lysinibacillus sp. BW-2-10 TaxID=2590030 RepID=UPI0011813A7D|nr:hydrogenase expression/formation protein HypE [Lysinibacillus sp. BW-2-10]TSI09704.1 hydrogenase expression/formation protein HypE [Lysinibacillus sp. BW-2-10]
MNQRISLAHGEGGELTHQLIKDVFLQSFGHQQHTQLDAAMIECKSKQLAITTDSYVVKPLFFPGGDIGKLAITGTVNDLAVSGATPQAITAGFIIEEGFSIKQLKTIVESMAKEAKNASVSIVAGDTKVVEKGSVDGLFINTTGIGFVKEKHQLHPECIQVGDSVIISGTVGDHGIAILSAREELGLLTNVQSDCASLNHIIQELMEEVDGIRVMRDPTRGGLATTLVELCEENHCTIELDECSIPVRQEVEGACDILGFDPLYLANEGKLVMIVDTNQKEMILEKLHNYDVTKDATVIGQIIECQKEVGKVVLKTPIGSTRRLFRLSGLLLPRIC